MTRQPRTPRRSDPPAEPMPFTIDQIRRALAAHPPQPPDPEPPRAPVAAVALVLAGSPRPSLCVIRRAERRGDPWSGHLALPGGSGRW